MYRNRIFLFFSLLIISLMMMSLQAKIGPVNPLSFLAYPLNLINDIVDRSADAIRAPFDKIKIAVKENREINRELRELRLELQWHEEAKKENKRLKEMLGLKDTQPGYVTVASLINKGADPWFRTMVLNKGSDDGVEKDMIAIIPGGLAGKIIRVWGEYSEMLMITDSSYSVSVRVQDSRVEGVLTGTGGAYCLLNYLSNEEEVEAGDILVSSGLDQFTPKGIPVGIVRYVRGTAPELFKYVEVAPFVESARMEEVMIIKR